MAALTLDNPDISKMSLEANRLATFHDWPFQDEGRADICTAEKLAEAGFYSIGTDTAPDLVRCYVCFKELEGWEPTDNPWEEHLSHASHCAFARRGTSQGKLTVEDFIDMEMYSQQNRVENIMGEKVNEVRKISENVLAELRKLGS